MILLLLLLFNPNYLITTTNAFVTTTTPIKTTSYYNNNNSFFIQKHQEQSRILKSYNYQHGNNGNHKVLNASPKSIQESDANNNNKNIISILSQNVINQFIKKKLIVKNFISRNRKNKKMVKSFLFGITFLFASCFYQHSTNANTNQCVASVASTLNNNNNKQCIERSISHRPSWEILKGGGNGNEKELLLASPSSSTSITLETTKNKIAETFQSMSGAKLDTLLLLLFTALVPPICQKYNISPILGFLLSGMLLGPNGLSLISRGNLHTTEILAELGIVFFLFEMGLELSVERLKKMKKDVFGLGFGQFIFSIIGLSLALPLQLGGAAALTSSSALIVVGSGLALSSSAFVLQLLKERDMLGTRFGKASFGVLLFQDLAVVPLLVLTPILANIAAGGGSSMSSITKAVSNACLKAIIALSTIFGMGRFLVQPFFRIVAGAKSQEAFLGCILVTVLGMSFLTEGLGLSNTLGAFLAGVLLSETKYRYQIEADIVPFRAILLGFFFMTVGFEIDLGIIASNKLLVSSLVFSILSIKTLVTTLLSYKVFNLSLSTSIQTGLILAQSGEFAFVTFTLARNLGLLTYYQTKLLLTVVALTMAATPFMWELGESISKRIEEQSDSSHYSAEDKECVEIENDDDGFVVVVGYGVVGKIVCDLLDQKFIKFIGLELDPKKAITARNKGFPVFYGDVGRSEVAHAFNIGQARAVILTIADQQEATRAVISLRRQYPDVKIFARAKDKEHAQRLQKFMDVIAMVPLFPEDNTLLVLPFAGAVLRSLGAEKEEVNAILEGKRKELIDMRGGIDVAEIELEFAQMCINEVLEPSIEVSSALKDSSIIVDDITYTNETSSVTTADVTDVMSSNYTTTSN